MTDGKEKHQLSTCQRAKEASFSPKMDHSTGVLFDLGRSLVLRRSSEVNQDKFDHKSQ